MKTLILIVLGLALCCEAYEIQNTMGSRFASKNFAKYSIGVKFTNEAWIVSGEGDRFIMKTPGLTGQAGSVSFESVNQPGHFIRHAGYVMWLHPYNEAPLYQSDSTFIPRPDKFYTGYTAFESVNFPNYFIRHQGFRLRISPNDGTTLMKLDASFLAYAAVPLVPVSQLSGPQPFKSYNYPAYSIGIKFGNQGYIVPGSTMKFKIMSPGLSGHAGSITIKSADDANLFLRHSGFLIYLMPYENTPLFKADASFYPCLNKFYPRRLYDHTGKLLLCIASMDAIPERKEDLNDKKLITTAIQMTGSHDLQNFTFKQLNRQCFLHLLAGYTAFESVNFPNFYIRHSGYRLKISSDDGTTLMHKDASFLGTSLPQTYRRKFGPFDFPSYNFPLYTIGLQNINEAFIVNNAASYKFRIVTPGLIGFPGSISFESVTKPGHFLRHRNYLMYLDPYLDQILYKSDATFFPHKNMYYERFAAFWSVNIFLNLIRHQGYRLKISEQDTTELMHKDSSFMLRQCFPVQPVQFDYGPFIIKSENFPAYSIGIQNGNEAKIINGNTMSFRMVSPGLCDKIGSVSFQLDATPSKFLKYVGALINLEEYQDTTLYKLESCFFIHPDKFYAGYFAFESVNLPNRYIRHQGYRLKLHVQDSSTLYRRDASFAPV